MMPEDAKSTLYITTCKYTVNSVDGWNGPSFVRTKAVK